MLSNVLKSSAKASAGLFSQVQSSVIRHRVHMHWVCPLTVRRLSREFALADMFASTMTGKEKTHRSAHVHKLLQVRYGNECAAIAGIEVGDGQALQEYVGEHHLWVLNGATCFVHVVEVSELFRGLGLQKVIWGEISKYAINNQLANIAFNPIDEVKYFDYFARFGIGLDLHTLSQPIIVNYDDRGKPIYRGEDTINLAVINAGDFEKLQGGNSLLQRVSLTLGC